MWTWSWWRKIVSKSHVAFGRFCLVTEKTDNFLSLTKLTEVSETSFERFLSDINYTGRWKPCARNIRTWEFVAFLEWQDGFVSVVSAGVWPDQFFVGSRQRQVQLGQQCSLVLFAPQPPKHPPHTTCTAPWYVTTTSNPAILTPPPLNCLEPWTLNGLIGLCNTLRIFFIFRPTIYCGGRFLIN